MDCKITLCNLSQARSRGMSLMEIMITTVVLTLVFCAVISLASYTSRSFAALVNYADLDNGSRNAIDTMSTEIRQSLDLKSASATNLTFDAVDINTGATNDLQYSYDSAGQTLKRTYNGQSSTLLTGCTYLQFGLYQRNTTTNFSISNFGNYSNNYVPVATTNASVCKVVQFTWVCSRKILGRTANTESVQSAQFVIRKK